MPADLARIVNAFSAQVKGVHELLDFDQFVLEHLVGGLTNLADDLEMQGRNNAANVVRNRLTALSNIRSSGSLRPKYETIFNQCIVLLVSYFGSTIGDLFKSAVADALSQRLDVPVADEVVKITWRHLAKPDAPVDVLVADLVVEQQAINFQDMQSIVRAFKDHLALNLGRPDVVNDIILGQSARHVIVHSGGQITGRMIRQVKTAVPRRLKQALEVGKPIQFEPDEVSQLAAAMSVYVQDTTALIGDLLGSAKSGAS